MNIPSGERLRSEWLQFVADKKRRYLLIAGAVLLLVAFAYWLFPFFEGIQGGETDIASTKNRIARYRQVVRGKGELEARLVALSKSVEQAEAGLLTGETEALAAVNIQNTLNEIAMGSGVVIGSMQVLKSPKAESNPNVRNPKKEEELYRSVPVQFSVSLTIRQLTDMLYKIEAHPKFFLTVEWIRISVAGAGSPGLIRCDIAVSGIMRNVQ
jgi:hypothetical protein